MCLRTPPSAALCPPEFKTHIHRLDVHHMTRARSVYVHDKRREDYRQLRRAVNLMDRSFEYENSVCGAKYVH